MEHPLRGGSKNHSRDAPQPPSPIYLIPLWLSPVNRPARVERGKKAGTRAPPPNRGVMWPWIAALCSTLLSGPMGVALVLIYPCGKAWNSPPEGTVKFSGSVADLADETRHAELPWISISTRHYQPRRLAVSPLRCELSRCRRSPGPTRHYGVLRSDPAVVPHVRFSIRSPAQASTGPAGRHLAPGRGLRHHPGTAALSLASCRSRW